MRVMRKLNLTDVIEALTNMFTIRGAPAYTRSDNGPEFISEAVRQWIKALGAETAYIWPGSPWENGYCETSNAWFWDKPLNGEILYTLREAQIVTEQGRRHYNTNRLVRSWIQTSRTRKDHAHGGRANDALPFKSDQSVGAVQKYFSRPESLV